MCPSPISELGNFFVTRVRQLLTNSAEGCIMQTICAKKQAFGGKLGDGSEATNAVVLESQPGRSFRGVSRPKIFNVWTQCGRRLFVPVAGPPQFILPPSFAVHHKGNLVGIGFICPHDWDVYSWQRARCQDTATTKRSKAWEINGHHGFS